MGGKVRVSSAPHPSLPAAEGSAHPSRATRVEIQGAAARGQGGVAPGQRPRGRPRGTRLLCAHEEHVQEASSTWSAVTPLPGCVKQQPCTHGLAARSLVLEAPGCCPGGRQGRRPHTVCYCCGISELVWSSLRLVEMTCDFVTAVLPFSAFCVRAPGHSCGSWQTVSSLSPRCHF